MKRLLLTCFGGIISVIFVFNFNFVSIKDSNYNTEQNKEIVYFSQKEEEKKEENKKEKNKKEEEEKKEKEKNKALVFIKKHKYKVPDFYIHSKAFEKTFKYIDFKKEEEKRMKGEDKRIQLFLTEKRKEDFKKMRNDLVYIHDVHTKHRIETLADNKPLHRALIRENRISWQNLQAKKSKNQDFSTEERIFKEANNNLVGFEQNQNDFLDMEHNILKYPHQKLGKEFRKRYKVIYNSNETDPEKRYKFKVKDLRDEYNEAKKLLNEEDIKEKIKKKHRIWTPSWVYKNACTLTMVGIFPSLTALLIKKVLFPYVSS